MTLPCDVIRDLLPLYHDGVCSPSSSELIRTHLSDCEACKKLLQALDAETEADAQLQAAKPLAAIGKEWKKTMKKALFKGAGITVLIFAVLIGSLLALTQWKWLSIDTVQMEVAEIYQLSDGRILYKLEVPAGVWSRRFEFTHCEDGSTYLTPKRSVIELNEQQGWGSLLDNYLMIDVAEQNAWAEKNGGVPETKYYIGNPEDPHALLVWQEGMILPPAPDALEALYG